MTTSSPPSASSAPSPSLVLPLSTKKYIFKPRTHHAAPTARIVRIPNSWTPVFRYPPPMSCVTRHFLFRCLPPIPVLPPPQPITQPPPQPQPQPKSQPQPNPTSALRRSTRPRKQTQLLLVDQQYEEERAYQRDSYRKSRSRTTASHTKKSIPARSASSNTNSTATTTSSVPPTDANATKSQAVDANVQAERTDLRRSTENVPQVEAHLPPMKRWRFNTVTDPQPPSQPHPFSYCNFNADSSHTNNEVDKNIGTACEMKSNMVRVVHQAVTKALEAHATASAKNASLVVKPTTTAATISSTSTTMTNAKHEPQQSTLHSRPSLDPQCLPQPSLSTETSRTAMLSGSDKNKTKRNSNSLSPHPQAQSRSQSQLQQPQSVEASRSQSVLIDDPAEYFLHGPRRWMHDLWGVEDRWTFLKLFHTFGKDFAAIASALSPPRSICAVVTFYYREKLFLGLDECVPSAVSTSAQSRINYLSTRRHQQRQPQQQARQHSQLDNNKSHYSYGDRQRMQYGDDEYDSDIYGDDDDFEDDGDDADDDDWDSDMASRRRGKKSKRKKKKKSINNDNIVKSAATAPNTGIANFILDSFISPTSSAPHNNAYFADAAQTRKRKRKTSHFHAVRHLKAQIDKPENSNANGNSSQADGSVGAEVKTGDDKPDDDDDDADGTYGRSYRLRQPVTMEDIRLYDLAVQSHTRACNPPRKGNCPVEGVQQVNSNGDQMMVTNDNQQNTNP